MAIAPITGTLRKRVLIDIVTGFTLGGAMASWWWWGYHKKIVFKREQFYHDLAEAKRGV
ncbi:cytochrome c oxidase subunit VIIa KNAG_0D04420 [Huiozyma naganishii CBS 8797]|uniref:Cytochrome c oxidase subunit 9, mitochondrial n=1 Tax=Huiozyma naganishii (strain ATCC MYA-139 / BCRC 22969 / CBS 8797 / KCTC 17520 / NBRC 10181 / NCYC 3082 / Yp74L-3) TaxID=1071383 RepID=J7RYF1_HUIN7|nr:hypothetical protein KNAG_0D04420 [Kazachstania naganishii CBS 8797]CCK70187.1 hypothetical protein KNAG_0D04420 [Kazachstania naganishii CBS 8797]